MQEKSMYHKYVLVTQVTMTTKNLTRNRSEIKKSCILPKNIFMLNNPVLVYILDINH